ncbi:MAG: integron integrase [Gemmataceae bacterium]|nr:integron integrase [Gemmataceae bacterium]
MIGQLLYGSGLRILECLRLRVKDLDFARNELTVREGKGAKDRVTIFPAAVQPGLTIHLEDVRTLHARDLRAGHGRVYLPNALARKYPGAAAEWEWMGVCPSVRLASESRSGKVRRRHLNGCALSTAIPVLNQGESGVIRPLDQGVRQWPLAC